MKKSYNPTNSNKCINTEKSYLEHFIVIRNVRVTHFKKSRTSVTCIYAIMFSG